MRKTLEGVFLGAALMALGSTSASATIAVLDQRPSLELASELSELAPGGSEPRVVLVGGPPRWAPAHGFRRKPGKAKHAGKHVRDYDHDDDDDKVARVLPDLGLERGFCNRELIGAILGGAAGGALGAQVGEGDVKTVATVGGTIAGVLIGGTIGRRMDQADHACVSHVVAHGETRSVVAWSGPAGESYHVVPLDAPYRDMRGRTCRAFQAIAVVDGTRRSERGIACRRPNGSWQQES